MGIKWFKKKKRNEKLITEPEDPAPILTPEPAQIEKQTQGVGDEKSAVAEAAPEKPDADSDSESGGLLKRLKSGLTKTRALLTTDIDALFTGKREIDEDFLEDLEEILITADIGAATSLELVEYITQKASKIKNARQLKEALKEKIIELIDIPAHLADTDLEKPHVIMVVGVNGVGKTTTIGKLATKYKTEGKKVLIAAADTFRAAAIEQLAIWAEKAGVGIVKHRDNADPSAVAFDAVEAAMARNVDIVIVDTAGRLHTKVNLMQEIKKIKRTIAKKLPLAPHEILLVLDATTGQNAISQTKQFNEALGVTGLVLAKLDGTARGGIVAPICSEQKIPLKYIGTGEKADDLEVFEPGRFVDALF